MMSLALKFGPYAVIAVLIWMVIDGKEDLAAAGAECNAGRLQAIAEAERVTRDAVQAAARVRVDALERMADKSEKARQIAQEALEIAESRPVEVREVIRESEDRCLEQQIDPTILDALRS